VSAFHLNTAIVRPKLNEIELDGRIERLPCRFIDVLAVLAERPGEVWTKRELLERIWNDPLVGDEALSHAVWILRRALGDDAKKPRYIETIPRRGYRLIAELAPLAEPTTHADAVAESPARTVSDDASPRTEALVHETRATRTRSRSDRLLRRGAWRAALLVLVASGIAMLAVALATRKPRDAQRFAFRTGGNVAALATARSGLALVADRDGAVFALDTVRGVERWRFATGTIPYFIPDASDELFVAGGDGYVYALDLESGRERWRHDVGAPVQSPPLTLRDRVVVGDAGGGVRALCRTDATTYWQVSLRARVLGPMLAIEDTVVARLIDGSIVGLDASAGTLRWRRRFDGPLADLVTLPGRALAVASDAGFVAAIDARDGATHWQVDLPAAELSPIVRGDTLYAMGRYGDLAALRVSDGASLWRRQFDIGDPYRPAWWNDRLVLVLDAGTVAIVDPTDGRLERTLRMADSPNALVADHGRLVVSAQSGAVYALDPSLLRGSATALALEADGTIEPASRDADARFAIEGLRDGVALPTLRWRARVLGRVQDLAVDEAGDVYLGDERSAVAFANDGAVSWRVALRPALSTAPALTEDRVLIGRRDRNVYALDRVTGAERWRFAAGDMVISPPTVVDDRVYVGSDDRRLYALDADTGRELWSFETRRPVRGAAVDAGGLVVFGSADHHVYAVDRDDGSLAWRYEAEDWVVAHPLVTKDRVFIGAGNGDFHALSLATGELLWRFRSGGKVWFRAAADAERVYFASGDGHVYALAQSTGEEAWRYRTGAASESSVVLVDGVIYAGSHDFHLYALDASDGAPRWRLRTGGSALNPAVQGQWLAFASADQHVYLVDLAPPPTRLALNEAAGSRTRSARSVTDRGDTDLEVRARRIGSEAPSASGHRWP